MGNQPGASVQYAFRNFSALESAAQPQPGYTSTRSTYTFELQAPYSPLWNTRATNVGVTLQTMRWASTAGQRPYAQALKPAAFASAVLRTARVWADRRVFYVAFTASDEDGAARMSPLPTATINATDRWAATGCSTGGLANAPYLGWCAVAVFASSFTGLTSDSTSSAALVVGSVGASFSGTSSVTLTPPPNWYESTLRQYHAGSRSATIPFLTEPAFATLPTHPLYANEAFDVLVFANTQLDNTDTLCAGSVCELGGFSITLFYDSAKLRYNSVQGSSHFGGLTIRAYTNNAPECVGAAACVTVAVTQIGAAGSASQRKGIFYLLRFSFSVQSISPGTVDTGLSIQVGEMFAHLSLSELARFKTGRVMDRRDNAVSRHASASIEVGAPQDVGVLVASADGSGMLFDSGRLTGVMSTRTLRGFTVTDLHTSDLPWSYATLTSCAADTAGSVTAAVTSGNCQLTLTSTAVSGLVTCSAQAGALSSTSYILRITSPEVVRLWLDDTVLNRLAQPSSLGGAVLASGSCAADEGVYQRTRVRVFADHLDVTSLVIGSSHNLVSSDPSVAALVLIPPRTAAYGTHDAALFLQGKSIGSTTVSLFTGSSATQAVTVEAATVHGTSMVNKMVTGVTWVQSPSTVYVFPTKDVVEVAVEQVRRAASACTRTLSLLARFLVFFVDLTTRISALLLAGAHAAALRRHGRALRLRVCERGHERRHHPRHHPVADGGCRQHVQR